MKCIAYFSVNEPLNLHIFGPDRKKTNKPAELIPIDVMPHYTLITIEYPKGQNSMHDPIAWLALLRQHWPFPSKVFCLGPYNKFQLIINECAIAIIN